MEQGNSQAGWTCLAGAVMGLFLGWLLAGNADPTYDQLFEGISIVISIVTAVALGFIGYQANLLVKRNQDRERAQEFSEARILMARLSPELNLMRNYYHVPLKILSSRGALESFAGKRDVRRNIAQLILRADFPLTNAHVSQLQVLPGKLGHSLALVLGISTHVSYVAKSASSYDTPGATQNGFGELIEPQPPADTAVRYFQVDFDSLSSSLALAVGELERAARAAEILLQARLN